MCRHTVVIATCNRKPYVLEAIESVCRQTLPPSEVIVVDDGSTDGTVEAIRLRFPQVCVVQQENRGVSIARNRGVARASGEFVSFLDDDDLWHERRLETVELYLQHEASCVAVNHPVWWFAEDGNGPVCAYGFERDFIARDLEGCHAEVANGDPSKNRTDYLKIRGASFDRLLEVCAGALSASTVARDALVSAGGFPPAVRSGQDWMMFLNVARIAEWHTIERRLAFCRLHGGQVTGNPDNGLVHLMCLAGSWLSGRAFPERVPRDEVLDRLSLRSRSYKVRVQSVLWSALRRGRFYDAIAALAMAGLLLPRMRHRMYALLPPPLTWRFERYVLGMHK
jgi:glycosyltransferase involved in cell wall biosynthesis